MEREEGFTLSFLGEDGRATLDLCGSRSGRDTDKAKAAGIKPRAFAVGSEVGGAAERGTPTRVAFEEARLVISCGKVHAQDIDPKGFIGDSISRSYPKGDYHRLYVGAIEGAWRRGQAR